MVINIIQQPDCSFRNVLDQHDGYPVVNGGTWGLTVIAKYTSIATIEYTPIDEDCYMRPFKFEARRLLCDLISG